MIASLTTQMLPALERDAAGVLVAARTRAARVSRPATAARLMGPLVGMSLERAVAVAEAMEARGYAGPSRSAAPGRALTARERVLTGLGAGTLAIVVAALVTGAGDFRYFDLLDDPWTAAAVAGSSALAVLSGGVRMGGAMPALTFEGVSHRYAAAGRPALAGVDLAVDEGELVLLVGESGSGKSTLLRAALGLVPHFHGGELRGRVRVAGLDTRRHRPGELARHAGLVFQDPEAQVVMSHVLAEAAFGLENLGVAPGEIHPRARAALEMVGAAHLAERTTRTLSGGERQRVAIASVLAMGPRVLLLDEPTSQLDPAAADELDPDADRPARPPRHRHRRRRAPHRAPVRRRRPRRRDAGGRDRGRRAAAARPRGPGRHAVASPPRPGRAAAGRRSGRSGGAARPREQAAGIDAGPRRRLDGVRPRRRDGGDRPQRRREDDARPRPCGLMDLDSGTATPTGRAGYVAQDPACYLLHDTALEEVEYGLKNLGVPPTARRERAVAELERFELGWAASEHPRDLSSGERQRLAIATVTAMRPDLVVLDEPTRGVDGRRKRDLAGLVRGLAAGGAGVVVVSHDALVRRRRRRPPRSPWTRGRIATHEAPTAEAVHA